MGNGFAMWISTYICSKGTTFFQHKHVAGCTNLASMVRFWWEPCIHPYRGVWRAVVGFFRPGDQPKELLFPSGGWVREYTWIEWIHCWEFMIIRSNWWCFLEHFELNVWFVDIRIATRSCFGEEWTWALHPSMKAKLFPGWFVGKFMAAASDHSWILKG